MNSINWLSMALATITPLVVGYLLFHPKVLGNASISAIGADGNTSRKIINVVTALICSFLLSFFLLNFNNDGINQEGDFDNFAHGAWHGLFVSITLGLPVMLISGMIWKAKWKHILINALYWIISLVLMGGIVDAMNHWENIVLPQ